MEEKKYIEVNNEILGGLFSAIERGETLKQAMMSFYRAGYDKTEIEDAARVYLEMENNSQKIEEIKKNNSIPEVKNKTKEDVKKGKEELVFKKNKSISEKALGNLNEEDLKTKQNISDYSLPKRPKNPPAGKYITLILILILATLLGVLTSVILFKDELVIFFNNLFG